MEADPKTLASLASVTLDGVEQKFRRFCAVGKAVFEGSGEAIAAAVNPEEARRIAAALNTAYGIPTEASKPGRSAPSRTPSTTSWLSSSPSSPRPATRTAAAAAAAPTAARPTGAGRFTRCGSRGSRTRISARAGMLPPLHTKPS